MLFAYLHLVAHIEALIRPFYAKGHDDRGFLDALPTI